MNRNQELKTRDDKIRFAADCIRSGIEVERVARHLCVKPASIYRWLGRKIYAQDDETGRIWSGPESMLPPGYSQTHLSRTGYLGNINGPGCDPDTP